MNIHKHYLIIASGLIFIVSLSGCISIRAKDEAKKIMNLIKDQQYDQVKKLCHYNPPWDQDDSIFNQNIRFIHGYLVKYGMPSGRDYHYSIDTLDRTTAVRVYLDKITSFDTALKSAYVEMDFFNLDVAFSDVPSYFKKKIALTEMKLAPPLITNFYLIRMKKGENYSIRY